jgi:hypothetical protein
VTAGHKRKLARVWMQQLVRVGRMGCVVGLARHISIMCMRCLEAHGLLGLWVKWEELLHWASTRKESWVQMLSQCARRERLGLGVMVAHSYYVSCADCLFGTDLDRMQPGGMHCLALVPEMYALLAGVL